MAESQVRWIVSRGISLREAAEWVGFKIEKLRDFSQGTQNELKAKVINSIMKDLDTEWEVEVGNGASTSLSGNLSEVERGIYVLCLDGGLCVSYAKGNSKVVYIGKGRIRQRIKSHLDIKLLDFFLQIPGIQFRFYMTEPKKSGPRGSDYFHDFEHDLLEEFSNLYGGQWPIFNKNAGRRFCQHSCQFAWSTEFGLRYEVSCSRERLGCGVWRATRRRFRSGPSARPRITAGSDAALAASSSTSAAQAC